MGAAAASPAATPAGVVAATEVRARAEIDVIEPPFQPPRTWAYAPAELTVETGASVTWINTGAVVHTVTSDDGKAFSSGDIGPKASFIFTPKSAGTFAYHCVYHPWMKGKLVVQP